jgi:hypothetical protein
MFVYFIKNMRIKKQTNLLKNEHWFVIFSIFLLLICLLVNVSYFILTKQEFYLKVSVLWLDAIVLLGVLLYKELYNKQSSS